MVQATEVRIGNWVKYDGNDTLFQVIEISSNGFKVINSEEETWIECDEFSPIILNPLILKKWLGFEEIYKSDYTWKFDCVKNTKFSAQWNLANGQFHILYVSEKFTHVKSVHQLQNFYFSNTGEELEIKKENESKIQR